MGSEQSTLTTTEIKEHPQKQEAPPCSESGRKQSTSDNVLVEPDMISIDEEDASVSSDTDSDESDDESVDSDDEEDEEWNERLQILEDIRNLRKVAEFFLCPEKPVVVDSTAKARCYFSRPSAPEATSHEEDEEAAMILAEARALKKLAVDYMEPGPVEVDTACFGRNYFTRPSAPTNEEEEERAMVLADALALKKLAVDYLHPEKPVVTSDPCATGRNYFTRPSAVEYDDEDDAAERAQILADALALKKLAVDYLHPEMPVVTSDPCATGRNYFTLPSAEEYEDEDGAAERAQILADAQALKKLAVDYLHPELPVVTSDPCATGRNYFTRPSAEEYEDEETMDDRDEILEDMAELKRLAQDYLQPERPVEMDALASCRNYFDHPSAPDQEDFEEAEERARILADAQALKKLAVDYLHPEKPVVTSDPCAMARNYFSRASAVEYDDEEDADERAQILADAAQLKKLAVDYLHPEKPVVTSDPCAMGRNFFSRPSAMEYDDEEVADERAQILADAAKLKRLAVDYLHPENPVEVDANVMGRNYFSRFSAEEQEDEDAMDEREDVLSDAMELKRLAQDYLMPERPVLMDAMISGRNYFTRPSAPSNEEEDERAMVLADALALKKLAVDYLHPERPVVTSDPCATGRNYFTRPSAEEYEDEDGAAERAQILADAQALKKLAVDYLHPELPVVTSDPCATGRNYFTRPSAEEYEDEETMDDRDEILEDMAELKRLAQDYLQPERPVEMDALASCRNYFDRPSAPDQEDFEEAEERARILADAQALKKLAVDYLHPEKPVVTSDPCAMGRNYFSRASAVEYDDEEDADERAQILADAAQLKKLAVDYLHPEKPVVTSDPCAMGRNFFSRPSAMEYDDEEVADERAQILADAAKLKRLAVDYLHPENPVEVDAIAMSRNYFSRYSADDMVDADSVQDMDQSLEDAGKLKKLANDYLHPEEPVKANDPAATGRNYFDRASAAGHAENIHSQGHAIQKADLTPAVADAHEYDNDGYYHYHVDDHLHPDHHDQSDHFEMDEDMAHEFQEFRQSLHTMVPLKGAAVPKEEEEGNLSRSPSSVMLFDDM